ncbi:hypothetical protein [Nocardia asiatica]|uniref:hypothetical protein n=1 Tax=Nocardia asiatica TaxID=209252 RepID=UPI003EDFD320
MATGQGIAQHPLGLADVVGRAVEHPRHPFLPQPAATAHPPVAFLLVGHTDLLAHPVDVHGAAIDHADDGRRAAGTAQFHGIAHGDVEETGVPHAVRANQRRQRDVALGEGARVHQRAGRGVHVVLGGVVLHEVEHRHQVVGGARFEQATQPGIQVERGHLRAHDRGQLGDQLLAITQDRRDDRANHLVVVGHTGTSIRQLGTRPNPGCLRAPDRGGSLGAGKGRATRSMP